MGQFDINLPDDDDDIEQLDEINLKRAEAPAVALAFAFRNPKTSASEITECKVFRRARRQIQ